MENLGLSYLFVSPLDFEFGVLDPTVSLGLRFTVVLKICGNFYFGVRYLDGAPRNIRS